MLDSSSLATSIRDDREYVMLYVCFDDRKVTTTFHLSHKHVHLNVKARKKLLNIQEKITILVYQASLMTHCQPIKYTGWFLQSSLNDKKILFIPPIFHENSFITDFQQKPQLFNFYFVKGFTKLYFMHCSHKVVLFFNTGLSKSAFYTYSFGKYRFSFFCVLFFRVSISLVFSFLFSCSML